MAVSVLSEARAGEAWKRRNKPSKNPGAMSAFMGMTKSS